MRKKTNIPFQWKKELAQDARAALLELLHLVKGKHCDRKVLEKLADTLTTVVKLSDIHASILGNALRRAVYATTYRGEMTLTDAQIRRRVLILAARMRTHPSTWRSKKSKYKLLGFCAAVYNALTPE